MFLLLATNHYVGKQGTAGSMGPIRWLHESTGPTTPKTEHAFKKKVPNFDVPAQIHATQKYPAGPDQKRARQKWPEKPPTATNLVATQRESRCNTNATLC